MRICSFLPSATEILYALGLGNEVVGVTFECDYPAEVRSKPVVVDSVLEHGLTQDEIDCQVSEHAAAGESLYRVNVELLKNLQPDLIVTQELCDVCAVSTSHLLASVQFLPNKPEVLSLTPHVLEDVWADIRRVGDITGRSKNADRLVAALRIELAETKRPPAESAPRVACLEWLNPPFNAGHWMPEMVGLAGGEDILGAAGRDSARITWQEVAASQPDVVVIMPCGYDTEAAATAFRKTMLPQQWAQLPAVREGRVFAVDANAYFSRPGPRLATGARILGALLSEEYAESLPERSWIRL